MFFGTPLYWRETHRQPRLLIFDGRLIILFLGVVLHIRLWTVLLALTAIVILYLFERKGVPADSILRYLRARLVGSRRTARGAAAERRAVDFGFETKGMLARQQATFKAAGPNLPSRAMNAKAKKVSLLSRLGLRNA